MDSWAQIQWDAVLHFFGNDDYTVNVWGTFLVSFVAYWSLGSFFTFIDVTGKPSAFLKYKVQDIKSYPISRAQLTDLLKVVLLNEILVIPLAIGAFRLNQWNGRTFERELPTLATSIASLVFFAICREVSFYYSHRLLHHPSIYKHIHKKHHTWISPVAISATYAHPLEHVISNVFPLILGPTILKSHTVLTWIWVCYVTFETLSVHSGFHLPGFTSPEFHDFHHLKFNFNYGVNGWLDWFHGTDSLFRKSKEFKRHKRIWTTTPVKVSIPS